MEFSFMNPSLPYNLPTGFSHIIVVLGFFDGIHKGHIRLFEKAQEFKKKNPLYQVCVITFDYPPSAFFQKKTIQTLFSKKEREILFKELNVDRSFFINPSKDFFSIKAKDFINLLLTYNQHIHFIVGEDSRFGNDQQGGVEFFNTICKDIPQILTFDVISAEYTKNKNKISSTYIRELFTEGEMQKVNELLFKPFFIFGEVVEGNKKGRLIGFPTLNVFYPNEKIVPTHGVYLSEVLIKNKIYKGLTYISNLKLDITLNTVLSETWVENFNEEIYTEKVFIFLKKFQRPPVKVESLEELKILLEKDKFSIYQS